MLIRQNGVNDLSSKSAAFNFPQTYLSFDTELKIRHCSNNVTEAQIKTIWSTPDWDISLDRVLKLYC